MRGKKLKNRGISLLLAIVIMVTTILLPAPSVDAATKNIKINDFIYQLVKSIDLKVDKKEKSPYLKAALKAGIVKDGEFTNYEKYITRTDAAVLVNRADEYLHGDTVNEKLINIVMEKRISDIKKVAKSKREAVAKVFAKGIVKGNSNGNYIQNRSFKGSSYLSASQAKSIINLVVNPKKRAKISPDGQLIRTTNLPKNASSYEYILACYPNKFYEKKFEFMFSEQYKAGERTPEIEIKPVDMRKSTFKNWYDEWAFSIEMDKYLYNWTELAETYLQYLFNVDYRTVDDKWINGLGAMYTKSNINYTDHIRTYYISQMKENKVIVESSIIAVEPSTLYDDGVYCMRAYVRYKITASDIDGKQNKMVFCDSPNFINLKNGEWRDGIFDIRFHSNNGSAGDGAYFAISSGTYFNDTFN